VSTHPSSEDVPGDVSDDAHVLVFPDGIAGLPGATRWVLSELADDGAFQLLQNLDDVDLAMVVGVPWLFFPDYAPDLADDEVRALGIEDPDDAVVFCSVTVPEDGSAPTMNLLGPFVVNRHTRQGRQVVLGLDDATVRAPLPMAV
jgi:flagellar assembly factor FliW